METRHYINVHSTQVWTKGTTTTLAALLAIRTVAQSVELGPAKPKALQVQVLLLAILIRLTETRTYRSLCLPKPA